MEIMVLHVVGCPYLLVTFGRVDEAVRTLSIDATINARLVTTAQETNALQFGGSPTVLIDGRDPFSSTAAGLSCRLYDTDDGPQGAPSVAQLVDALRR